MVFHDKYELLALRGGEGEIALPGREILSGQPVVVHLLTSTPEVRELMSQLNDLGVEDRRHVLDKGDHDGIQFVVTGVLPGKLGLKKWLETLRPVPAARVSQADAGPAQEAAEATRLFPSSAAVKATSAPKPPDAKPSVAAGEATRGAPATPASTPPPVSTPPRITPPGAETKPIPEPGEFTRLFKTPPPTMAASAPEPAEAAPAKPARQAAPEPGEFTRLMKTPAPGEPARRAVPETPAAAAVTPAEDATQVFTIGAKPGVPAAPKEAEPTTGMMKTPPQVKPASGAGPAPPDRVSKMAPGPGEFTQLFKTPPPIAPVTSPVTGASQPAEDKPAAESSEFSRMFKTPPPIAPPAQGQKSTARVVSPAAAPSEPEAPGAFTKMMQSPLAEAPVRDKAFGPNPLSPKSSQPPSEFTRMLKPEAFAEQPLAGKSPAAPGPQRGTPERAPFAAEGEFTRIFGGEARSADTLPNAPLQSPMPQGGLATGAFSTHSQATPSTGPGEFTSMFAAPAAKPAAPKSPPPPVAPAPQAAKSNLRLILILGGLFVLVVILILVFALTR